MIQNQVDPGGDAAVGGVAGNTIVVTVDHRVDIHIIPVRDPRRGVPSIVEHLERGHHFLGRLPDEMTPSLWWTHQQYRQAGDQ